MNTLSINFIENVSAICVLTSVEIPSTDSMLDLYLYANSLLKCIDSNSEVTVETYYRVVAGVVIATKLDLVPTDDRAIRIVNYMFNSEDQTILTDAFKALLRVIGTTDINRLHLLLTEYRRLGAEIRSKIQYPADLPTQPQEKNEWY
jgi:hypothetical protein